MRLLNGCDAHFGGRKEKAPMNYRIVYCVHNTGLFLTTHSSDRFIPGLFDCFTRKYISTSTNPSLATVAGSGVDTFNATQNNFKLRCVFTIGLSEALKVATV